MTIITADKQLVHGKAGDQRAERNRRREKVIESFGGTFRWKPLAVWEMLFTEWHLDYRVALLTITFNTSFFTIALEVQSNTALGIKKIVMWLFEGDPVTSLWIFLDFIRKAVEARQCFRPFPVSISTLGHLFRFQCLIIIIIIIIMICITGTSRYKDIQFLLCVAYVNIHWTTLSHCNP